MKKQLYVTMKQYLQTHKMIMHKKIKVQSQFNFHNGLTQALQKYMDVLSNFEQSLKIKPNSLRFKLKADSLFELRRKSEAKYFYFAAQTIGLGQNAYIQSQLSKL